MANASSKLENEFVVVSPPLIIQGEISLAQARKTWSIDKKPVLLLDVQALRETHGQSLAALPHEVAVIESPSELTLFELPVSEPPVPIEIEQVDSATAVVSQPNFGLAQKLILWSQDVFTFQSPFFQKKAQRILNITSHFFMGAAVAFLLLFAGPILILESQPLISQAIEHMEQWQPFYTKPIAQSPSLDVPTPEPTFEPTISSPEDVFSIAIPDLDITSAVIPNVDPNDPKIYSNALKRGIAHAQGTGLPEQLDFSKTIYLFAHSTDAPWNILRYNAQFYALKDAEPGQEISLTFWGKKYTYTIESKHIIEAQDVSYMQAQTEKEQLVLQTCYPPGTSQKRLVIIATPSAQLN